VVVYTTFRRCLGIHNIDTILSKRISFGGYW
jgi:hypothetical protein